LNDFKSAKFVKYARVVFGLNKTQKREKNKKKKGFKEIKLAHINYLTNFLRNHICILKQNQVLLQNANMNVCMLVLNFFKSRDVTVETCTHFVHLNLSKSLI
jgi:hypothetical protein